MTNKNHIKTTDYEKASVLLSNLISEDSDVTAQINTYIQHNGIVHFFENLESYELDVEALQGLYAYNIV